MMHCNWDRLAWVMNDESWSRSMKLFYDKAQLVLRWVTIFSCAGWANSITGRKLSHLYACVYVFTFPSDIPTPDNQSPTDISPDSPWYNCTPNIPRTILPNASWVTQPMGCFCMCKLPQTQPGLAITTCIISAAELCIIYKYKVL